jgi:hypothetical protein
MEINNMRYDIILQRLRPHAKWSFVTSFNSGQISRKADGSIAVGHDEPILESYAAIIWNDATELQPTEQECADEWDIYQLENTTKEQREAQLKSDIATDRATYTNTVIDEKQITLEILARRVKWLENEIRQMKGL